MKRLESQMETLRRHTSVTYLDATYMTLGMALIVPRKSTLGFNTDTGVGVQGGVGHYFGENHVAELTLDWDLYPAVSLRYRFELHASDSFGVAAIIGGKQRVFKVRPWDNYLEYPLSLRANYLILGAGLQVPFNQVLMSGNLEFWTNKQTFIVVLMNAHIHFN